jgi:fatty-acyl-CoA synthase
MLDRTAQRFGGREAFSFEEQRWSFRELKADSDRAACGLIQCGVQPGDKVALWLTNRPEWLHILFAVAKIGAIFVPINTRFRTTDLEYVLRQSDSTMLITTDHSGPIGYRDMVCELIPELTTCAAPLMGHPHSTPAMLYYRPWKTGWRLSKKAVRASRPSTLLLHRSSGF